jgi:phosphatidylglycerophosphatase A
VDLECKKSATREDVVQSLNSRVSILVHIATLGPLGYCRYAPATIATAVAGIPAAILVGLLPPLAALAFVLAVVIFSCWCADAAEKSMGRSDPGEIVVDELAGYLVTMATLPITVPSLLIGFAAFRLFDIWKPWPICKFHRAFKGGTGVVLDDIGAGIYAHLLVWLVSSM